MWTSVILAFAALALLIYPKTRKRETSLALACGAVFVSLWIEKGLGLVVTGFIPSPLEKITEYVRRPGNRRHPGRVGRRTPDSDGPVSDICRYP